MDIIDKSNIDIKSIQPSNSTDCNDDKKNLYETRIQQIIRRTPGGDKSVSISMVSNLLQNWSASNHFLHMICSITMRFNHILVTGSGIALGQIPYHILYTMLAWSTI